MSKITTKIGTSYSILFFIILFLALFIWTQTPSKVTEQDWAQYKKDNYRSGIASDSLQLNTLGLAWEYQTQLPNRAWYGPAKEDAFAVSGALPSMRDYDLSYYPIVVGTSLYYASTSDDAIHCLSTKDGKEKWSFQTFGPIHMAPTYYKGKLYFGSDDGFLYCINAVSGKEIWKFSPSESEQHKLFNNGRFISFYPIRTGTLIENDIVYFGASLLPWKKSFICAINAKSGKLDLPNTYVKEYNNQTMTLEGYMASNGNMLIQPQGRISPIFIDKATGNVKGRLPGTGGCFVLVTPNKNIAHLHSSRYISAAESDLSKKKMPEFMTFKEGKELIVKGDTSYVLNRKSIAAYSRTSKKLIWLKNNYQAQRIIMVGNRLIAGGTDSLYILNSTNGSPLWKSPVQGTIYALCYAQKALYASTNEGKLYCFRGLKKENNPLFISSNNTQLPTIDPKPVEKKRTLRFDTLAFRVEPSINPYSFDTIALSFETENKETITVEWGAANEKRASLRIQEKQETKKHLFKLPVRPYLSYYYTIKGVQKIYAKNMVYDNFFNFNEPKLEFKSAEEPTTEMTQLLSTKKKGLCFVIGEQPTKTALQIAKYTSYNIVQFINSEISAKRVIKQLQEENLYGKRIAVLPFYPKKNNLNSTIADLIWVENGKLFKPDNIIDLIAPHGQAIVKNISNNWFKESSLTWQIDKKQLNNNSFLITKKPIENIGAWTHQYGRTDNSAFCGESLWGNSSQKDFEIQWMGRPGPRFITDRSGRKPSPLAVKGKLFIQGNRRIAALNVYNGTILWSKDIPSLLRMNVTRDCSNWAADSSSLYLVMRNKLYQLEQTTGEILSCITTPKEKEVKDWGYLGITHNNIIGSTIAFNSNYTDYYGGAGWYDAASGPLSYKVITNHLFALDKNTQEKEWDYQTTGAIIHPTIIIDDEKIAFVESRSANKKSILTGRGGDEIYEATYIVQLDLNTGKKIYEKRFKMQPGLTVYYMASSSHRYVIVSSQKGLFEITTFDSSNGEPIWTSKKRWFNSNHGAHMSRPAIVGNRLIVKPYIFNLETGEQYEFNIPKVGHGCASYALSEQSIFYRGGSVAQFCFDNRNFSKWERLRPDCWISTIPAQGMLLSPEAAGGCSCGNWYETSMVMAPKSRAPITISSLGETAKLDYKKETWGTYTRNCPFDQFKEKLQVKLSLKPGLKMPIYYTIDGTTPNKNSKTYKKPILLKESCTLKTAIYMKKDGKDYKMTRQQAFLKK